MKHHNTISSLSFELMGRLIEEAEKTSPYIRSLCEDIKKVVNEAYKDIKDIKETEVLNVTSVQKTKPQSLRP